jgi:hypothetical protein
MKHYSYIITLYIYNHAINFASTFPGIPVSPDWQRHVHIEQSSGLLILKLVKSDQVI